MNYNKVAYIIIDGCCYYSGIDSMMDRSTVNSAEDIIESISAQEGISYKELRWFDLQTYRGYISKKPGECELDELILSDLPSNRTKRESKYYVKSFEPRECPLEILESFKACIG
ncbi:MAG: hypothetical protein Q8L47_02785 [bacterium]|nr:hypothetical protein [bacterium]